MKKFILTSVFALVGVFSFSQKFALIDMEYVLKNIPSYETTNEQLTLLSKRWQNEIEEIQQTVQTMKDNYKTELVFLSDEMKSKREAEILEKEKEAADLKRKYFGAQGEFYKKRESLIKPLQEEIYNAVQEVCNEKFYQMVMDKSSSANIIFAAPKIDISDEVLQKLGYSK